MELDEVLLNICTQYLDQNFGESDENMCEKCFKMKHYLEVLINELKSTQLIINILQQEITTASTGPGIQDNLTTVPSISYVEHHTTNRKNSPWKEI
jgi:hypothetical protein